MEVNPIPEISETWREGKGRFIRTRILLIPPYPQNPKPGVIHPSDAISELLTRIGWSLVCQATFRLSPSGLSPAARKIVDQTLLNLQVLRNIEQIPSFPRNVCLNPRTCLSCHMGNMGISILTKNKTWRISHGELAGNPTYPYCAWRYRGTGDVYIKSFVSPYPRFSLEIMLGVLLLEHR